MQLITNIPSYFDVYYNSIAGESMKKNFRNNCEIYLRKLDPEKFESKAMSFFNFRNHAKIVGTENIVYIGSANFSNESKNNIESGIIIEDKEFLKILEVEKQSLLVSALNFQRMICLIFIMICNCFRIFKLWLSILTQTKMMNIMTEWNVLFNYVIP